MLKDPYRRPPKVARLSDGLFGGNIKSQLDAYTSSGLAKLVER